MNTIDDLLIEMRVHMAEMRETVTALRALAVRLDQALTRPPAQEPEPEVEAPTPKRRKAR